MPVEGVKLDGSLRDQSPTVVDVSGVLAWKPRNILRAEKEAPRAESELKVYEVTGWVRRIKKHEDDGDWHIELTENDDDAVRTCIIVEIPSDDHGAYYGTARSCLDAILDNEGATLKRNGELSDPVQVTIIGAAFFDGYHQKAATSTSKAKASGHGRCNATIGALWELHTVYKVMEPDKP